VRIRADRRPAHTVTRQRPSYSAKAEYPVRRSFSFPLLTSQNTGSPAFAGDDGCECGAFIFNGCYRFNFQTARKPIAVIPGRCEASNPESRDSPMRNCASEVWSFGPSRNDGVWVTSLAMTSSQQTTSCSRREAPEALMNLPPKEGVGNAGCPPHPRPRVHFVLVERTRVYEYTGITRHSRTQWF